MEFYGVDPLIRYIRGQYILNISRLGIEGLVTQTRRTTQLYPQLVNKITKQINPKFKEIQK